MSATAVRVATSDHGRAHFAIDPAGVELATLSDCTYVVRRNAGLTPLQVAANCWNTRRCSALRYGERWMVESNFGLARAPLATRLIFHKCDDTIPGPVFCSFLALAPHKQLQDRLAAGHDLE